MAQVLVIGIGNPLRSDDGLGWRVAEELGRDAEPTILKVIKVHQLTPEIAESLSRVEQVIFVDAAAQGVAGTLTCQKVCAAGADLRHSHHVTPETLVEMAGILYGAKPVAYVLSLAGRSFEHGDSLSPEIAQALPRVLAKVRELIAGSPGP
jgi:hydrogenase maturation protease